MKIKNVYLCSMKLYVIQHLKTKKIKIEDLPNYSYFKCIFTVFLVP